MDPNNPNTSSSLSSLSIPLHQTSHDSNLDDPHALMQKFFLRAEKTTSIAKSRLVKSDELLQECFTAHSSIVQSKNFWKTELEASLDECLSSLNQMINLLTSYSPSIDRLSEQLSTEQNTLNEYVMTFNRLSSTQVMEELKDYILPYPVPEAANGTLGEWINSEDVERNRQMLQEDIDSMKHLADWGQPNIQRIKAKQNALLAEVEACRQFISQLLLDDQELAMFTEAQSIVQKVRTSVQECSTICDRLSNALNQSDFSNLSSFATIDKGFPATLAQLVTLSQRLGTIAEALKEEASNRESSVSKITALLQVTADFQVEARTLHIEFVNMDKDITNYLNPTGNANGFSAIQFSTSAWNDMFKTYHNIVSEVRRRRHVLQQHAVIASKFQEELFKLYESEVVSRESFSSQLAPLNLPTSWKSLELLAELPVRYTVYRSSDATLLPQLPDTKSEQSLLSTNPTSSASLSIPPSSMIVSLSQTELKASNPKLSHLPLAPSASSPLSIVPLPTTTIHSSTHSKQMSNSTGVQLNTTPPSMNVLLRATPSNLSNSTDDHNANFGYNSLTNSLLGSEYSISESMLEASGSLYKSAVANSLDRSTQH